MAIINDLQGYLRRVAEMGELVKVDGADWDQEIGCVGSLNKKVANPPALLFDNIKGYPQGYRVTSFVMGNRARTQLTLNLPSAQSDMELLEIMRHKVLQWESEAKDYPPQVVKSGPILENVHSGKDIDILEFPVPRWHEGDGGRYIGTGDAVITRDPDTGEVNLGTYRIMVHDKRTTGLHISPGKDGRIHLEKWHEQGKACPVAISVGHHPLMFLVASRAIPGSEYGFAGAVRRQPVKVIKEEVTGLPIPADAEIVLAGWCPPGKTRMEGPFGEWTGYYASKDRPEPVVEVERIYHRSNPVILGTSNLARAPSCDAYCHSLFGSALVYNDLVRNGVPDVKGVWVATISDRTFVTVSIKQRFPGHAKRAALLTCQSRLAAYMGRYVVVVDDDIDPSDINDVLWAMCFRSDPEKDIDIIRHCWSTPLDPMVRKPTNATYNSRAVIDACKPFDWIDEFPKEVKSNPEVMDRVKKRWGSVLKL